MHLIFSFLLAGAISITQWNTVETCTETPTTTTVTVPETVTIPGEGEITTVTVPTTVTLPGEDEIITVTVPTTVVSVTTTTTSTTETTTVAGGAACPTASQILLNPSFETDDAWIRQSNPSIPSGFVRRTVGSEAADGSAIMQTAIDRVVNAHEGNQLLQAVRVCPGEKYQFSMILRTISASAPDRPTLVSVLADGAVFLQSGALTVENGWVPFTGTFTAKADTVLIQIRFWNSSPETSPNAIWSYLWIDAVTATRIA
ncbi:hypothetical protein QBC33DRAFT_620719 [Phialemonium atrogriseum]|uniref:CBM-cenC domain-containing protein n=1 Tax=Phialemonium atrogriseum TaxID=1093897 RepID=A0AAJ0FKE2_9PEZI|nr:uncharacterized protein QBC33DRAFT_620719 [Phialemonium atrogriseum]KAK1766318.1 hypothetical protein QBC33DRAFT_620719 [Phialemonium atrogriseum]